MSNHGDYLGIHQFLRNGGTDFRVCLIILRHELDVQYFAVNLDLLGIGLIDCQAYTVLIVFAQVRNGPGQRSGVRDCDRHRRFNRRGGCGDRSGFYLFLAAGD